MEVRRSDGHGGKTLYQLEIDIIVNIDARKVYVPCQILRPRSYITVPLGRHPAERARADLRARAVW